MAVKRGGKFTARNDLHMAEANNIRLVKFPIGQATVVVGYGYDIKMQT